MAARLSASSQAPCTTHRAHHPRPTYSELHHVIPQAWQVLFKPPAPWPNAGPSPDRYDVTTRKPLELWDARTVPLCRTGHGNVHWFLVATMRELALLAPADTPIAAKIASAFANARAKMSVRPPICEAGIALEAMGRFSDAGGDLFALLRAHEYGEI